MPAFPTFEAGNTLFCPLTRRRTWKNLSGDNLVGYRFSYNERSSAPLMEWAFDNVIMSDADLVTIKTFFFTTCAGAYEDFSFTDPDTGTNYPKCRFIGDELAPRMVGPNENILTVAWRELV